MMQSDDTSFEDAELDGAKFSIKKTRQISDSILFGAYQGKRKETP